MQNAELPDALRDQITRSKVALSLAAAGEADMPLRLVNDAFCRLTGYTRTDVEGSNCRLLQTPDTHPEQVRAMSAFLHRDDRDDGRFPLLNRTRQGRTFTNLVFMAKLRDGEGRVRFIIASQFDMDAAHRGRHRPADRSRHDVELSRSLGDLRQVSAQVGIIMADSTALMARSVNTLARIAVRDE
jgi:PAS domain S-box-containing protein